MALGFLKKTSDDLNNVSILPGVNILSVLPHLNYKPWFAIGEFVDNAVQSYIANRERLKAVEGKNYRLKVDIIFDASASEITIRDNAAGISSKDYVRAFKPAEVPPDASGLSEFGMGMKSAACWFTLTWSVRTSALGEKTERLVQFDIDSIVKSKIEALKVNSKAAIPDQHFTEVKLHDIKRFPKGKTVAKIKEHLADIYRMFLRSGAVELYFNGEPLSYEEPDSLVAPYYADPNGPERTWKAPVDFALSGGKRVRGFVAIRKVGSVSRAGLALFRRFRLIQGSADEGYRPEQIFVSPNSFTYQRVFGELQLEGFSVSHTKDGIQWADQEEEFLSKLELAISNKDCPLLQQAEGYRAKAHAGKNSKDLEPAIQKTAAVMEKKIGEVLNTTPTQEDEPPPETLPPPAANVSRTLKIKVGTQEWTISIELATDPAISDWLSIGDQVVDEGSSNVRRLELRISMAHPFMERFAVGGQDNVEAILRIAVALGLAEVRARDAGLKKAGSIRRNVNELLTEMFSLP